VRTPDRPVLGFGRQALARQASLSSGPSARPVADPPLASPSAAGPFYQALSNERTVTYWAHTAIPAPIRYSPDPGSKRRASLHYSTEDGFAEIYLVLTRYVDAKGAEWLKVRIPGRPNGRTGWVARRALGPLNRVSTQLVINRPGLRATLYRDGQAIWTSRLGIGKASSPTPAGSFWIRERLLVRPTGGVYGPLAFGTAAYSSLTDWPGGGVVGIHGTNQPYLIPGRPSHGCIRVPNPAILRLGSLLPLGTPLRIV
jgi:L,D-transpeptidase catalytic domain